jgi:RNA recognition motif-containing protein
MKSDISTRHEATYRSEGADRQGRKTDRSGNQPRQYDSSGFKQRSKEAKEEIGSSESYESGSSSESDVVRPKGKQRLEEFRDDQQAIITPLPVHSDSSSILPDFFAALIKNVDRTVTPQHIQGIFQHFGLITSEEPLRIFDPTVSVPKEEIQIQFSTPSDLELAIQHMSGGLINGRKVVMERIPRPLVSHTSGPRKGAV